MKTILFACVHNAGRSQMAAALFNALADRSRARAISAGTKPGPCIHPEVVEVMREFGIDLSTSEPRRLTEELAAQADLLVTMGCGEDCPYLPSLRREDWTLPDPKDQPIERVRETRAEIEKRVRQLLAVEGWSRAER